MRTSRSPLRAAVAALLALGLVALAACGDDDGTASAGTDDGGGEWTYTDGSGRETRLEERPERIVAHANAAAALLAFGIRPVGIYADSPIAADLGLRDDDLEGIEIVGEEWGVINVEAVAALQPDLIVAEWWPVEEAYSGLEEGTGAASQQLTEIAPIVGVAQGPSIHEMIEGYEDLAERLGADLDDPEVTAARDGFEAALERFQAAVAAAPDLSVLAVSPDTESLYVAVPEHSAELSDLASWGLDLVVPDSPDEGFEYWETLSWENADKYQADLLIVDERSYPENLALAEAQPTWTLLQAAAHDAVAIWPAYWVRTYADYAMALDRLTAAVEAADAQLVS
jgi:iron complex transport system substrate-binding protein